MYVCAADLVVEWLQGEKTSTGLFSAYFGRDPELIRLVTEQCADGETVLQPRVLMGASCGLRLRQLIAETTQ